MDDSDMEELARSIEQYNTISNKKQWNEQFYGCNFFIINI
jgi:hypothetical protein